MFTIVKDARYESYKALERVVEGIRTTVKDGGEADMGDFVIRLQMHIVPDPAMLKNQTCPHDFK